MKFFKRKNKVTKANLYDKLDGKLSGDVDTDQKTRDFYSHDTSLFEIVPQAVVSPFDLYDVQELVRFTNEHKDKFPSLSLTARSGGTDMSGGAINESIIVNFKRYMNRIGKVKQNHISVMPGAYYRDFEKVTLKEGLIMPAYPASREICALGGMIVNNAGGEKSLIYGKVEDYVRRLDVVLSDGNAYRVEPLDKKQLAAKMEQTDFEGEIYRKTFELVDKNYDLLKRSKPKVSKNSTGYKLWDIWDKKTFDLTQLFVGSQGTLGLVTDAELGLVRHKPRTGMLVGYMQNLDHLANVIQKVVKHEPTSFETFDDYTFKFALRFFLTFRKTLGWWGLIKLAISFIPDGLILLRRGIPKLIILVEFEGDTHEEIKAKVNALHDDLREYKEIEIEHASSERQAKRFWLMRRESFNLLRKNVKNKHTAPFIDDLVVPPNELPEFLPKLHTIIEKYELLSTIAGHMGDGNFHIIPLMDLRDEKERAKIEPCLKEVISLVQEHKGVISGEHNDGLIRSPYLKQMYGKEVYDLFKQVKNIFDPKNIFNPHKKTDADWEYSKAHMRDHF